jgi:hypothetical protein
VLLLRAVRDTKQKQVRGVERKLDNRLWVIAEVVSPAPRQATAAPVHRHTLLIGERGGAPQVVPCDRLVDADRGRCINPIAARATLEASPDCGSDSDCLQPAGAS